MPYPSVQQIVICPISTLSAMYFVYGIYVSLFGIYIYMMRTSRDQTGERRNKDLYLILTVALFVLSTILVVNETAYYVHGAVVGFDAVKNGDYDLFERYQNQGDFEERVGYTIGGFLTVFLNIAAEWMLIHRCYLIWDCNKLVGIPLIMTSVLINACGLATYTILSIAITNLTTPGLSAANLLVIESNFETGYLIAYLVNNIIITLMTAGRIWWIQRQVRAHGIYSSNKPFQSVSRLILESGMIYPAMMMVDVISFKTVPFDRITFDPFPLVALSAGIAPTLIMVRAKLGQNVESLQEAVSDIYFTSQTAQRGLGGTTTFQSEAQVLSVARNPSSDFEGGEGQVGNSKEATAIV